MASFEELVAEANRRRSSAGTSPGSTGAPPKSGRAGTTPSASPNERRPPSTCSTSNVAAGAARRAARLPPLSLVPRATPPTWPSPRSACAHVVVTWSRSSKRSKRCPSQQRPSTWSPAGIRSPPGGARSPECSPLVGTYFSQQVGPRSVAELSELMLGPTPSSGRRSGAPRRPLPQPQVSSSETCGWNASERSSTTSALLCTSCGSSCGSCRASRSSASATGCSPCTRRSARRALRRPRQPIPDRGVEARVTPAIVPRPLTLVERKLSGTGCRGRPRPCRWTGRPRRADRRGGRGRPRRG